MKRIIWLALATVLFAKRGEFVNSLGKDGKFHTRPDMYLCLNFAWNPGDDIRYEASLKGELDFEGIEGNSGLKDSKACTPVSAVMIERVNDRLKLVVEKIGPVPTR